MVQQQVLQPRGECRSLAHCSKGLADRMGLQSYFPWPDDEALLDYRVSRGGNVGKMEGAMFLGDAAQVNPLETGFATPTGKIELYSTVLEQLARSAALL